MFNKVIFIFLFLVTIASYIYMHDEMMFGTVGIYQLVSAFFMFFAMYAGAFGKFIPCKLVKFIFINTLVAAAIGVYQELNANFELMTHLELLSYATFVIIYYALSLRLIQQVQNRH